MGAAPSRHTHAHYTIRAADHDRLPTVRLHPATTDRLGLADHGTGYLASSLGRLQVRIKNDPGVRPDCVVAERGGWIKAGHGLNRLTLDRPSHVGEGTPYYDTCVTLTAAPPTLS